MIRKEYLVTRMPKTVSEVSVLAIVLIPITDESTLVLRVTIKGGDLR